MDAATKSRTSEDILRSSRLSAYSPEPCSQSESDYYPYTSSPRGTNAPSPQSHHELPCSRSVEQRTAPVPFFFCNSAVVTFGSAALALASRCLCQRISFICSRSLSLSDAEETLLDGGRRRELEQQPSKSKRLRYISYWHHRHHHDPQLM